MVLASGTRLVRYEILSPIGAGGMGEVYRARDSRLTRTVAIKVLPPLLSSDERFKQRFELEARAISSLNHPHIVMEYLDGETLSHRLERGSLPIEEALKIKKPIVAGSSTAI